MTQISGLATNGYSNYFGFDVNSF